MITCGVLMLLAFAWAIFLKIKKRDLSEQRPFLWFSVFCAPLGFIAIEAGWMVTEVGRQPFIISGYMLTKDAVTHVPYLSVTFSLFVLIYFVLAMAVIYLMRKQVFLSLGVDNVDT